MKLTLPSLNTLRRVRSRITNAAPLKDSTTRENSATYMDAGIRAIIESTRPYTMTSEARIANLCLAIDYITSNSIRGDLVECGVWQGGSTMAAMMRLLENGVTDRHAHLFDTFEGMPPPGKEDVDLRGNEAAALLEISDKQTSNVWAYCDIQTVEQNVSRVGYPRNKIHLTRGRVEDTLPEKAPGTIAILRLDTDWYQSTYHELQTLFPRLSAGGVLIVDDYGHWQGAKKAVDQYFSEINMPILLVPVDYTCRIAVKPCNFRTNAGTQDSTPARPDTLSGR